MTWTERAACIGLAPMFDWTLTDHYSDEPPARREERFRRAADICSACPVRDRCEADWLPGRDEGIRNGRVLPSLDRVSGRRARRVA